MNDDIPFDRTPPVAGHVETVSTRLRRIVAPNAGPFTFTGTCSYIVGHGRVAIVDPGPDDPDHVARLLEAVRGESVEAVVVTHTHRDHSPASRAVAAATGARTYGAGPHRSARPLQLGEVNPLDASADHDFVPETRLGDGDAITGSGWTLQALTTPGHCANHLAFALAEDDLLLSGDHVMAWSTSIVAPPDGAMGDYMASLQKLAGRSERRYFPGHGGPVTSPQAFIRGLITHRRMREASILRAIADGERAIPAIVARVYEGLRPELLGAAALNNLAHLEDLCARGVVRTDGPAAMNGQFAPAG